MTTTIDLTPFGFTSTESRVYNALLDLGPSSGYALARATGLARANTYHALSSLGAKGAITVLADEPLRVRAVRPDGLATLIGSRYSERLDALEEQVRRRGDAPGAEVTTPITSERALIEIVTRMIVREEGAMAVVAPARFYGATQPAWRKRKADNLPSQCWSYGDSPGGAQPIPASSLAAEDVGRIVGPGAVLVAATSSAVWATWDQSARGWWSQEHLSIQLVRSSIANISGV